MAAAPATLWDAVAVTGTNAYKSKVVEPSEDNSGNTWHHFNKTGDAAGVLKLQINLREKKRYERDVDQAAGATYTAKEAANVAGWTDVDLSPTDTIAVPSGTDPYDEPIFLPTMKVRHRWVYTNATGTGTITDTVQVA